MHGPRLAPGPVAPDRKGFLQPLAVWVMRRRFCWDRSNDDQRRVQAGVAGQLIVIWVRRKRNARIVRPELSDRHGDGAVVDDSVDHGARLVTAEAGLLARYEVHP